MLRHFYPSLGCSTTPHGYGSPTLERQIPPGLVLRGWGCPQTTCAWRTRWCWRGSATGSRSSLTRPAKPLASYLTSTRYCVECARFKFIRQHGPAVGMIGLMNANTDGNNLWGHPSDHCRLEARGVSLVKRYLLLHLTFLRVHVRVFRLRYDGYTRHVPLKKRRCGHLYYSHSLP